MKSVGVLDRTGSVLPVVGEAAHRAAGLTEVVDMGRAVDLTPASPRVDVLVLGPRECTAAGTRRLARWTAAFPGSAVVAFVGEQRTDTTALRAAGVDVLVRREPTVARAASALAKARDMLDLLAQQASEVEREEQPEPAPVALLPSAEEPEAPAQDEQVRGTVLTIASASGGCGKTFLATNLAALLAQGGLRVLLVDLDLQFGEVAAALRVRHPYSLYDGLYDAAGAPLPRTDLDEHLDALVAPHALGFDVLTAPREPALADHVGSRDAAHVLDVVSLRYEVVVVDTPPSLNEVVLAALDRSDLVTVLATLDVPSLKNLTVFLDTLQRLGVDDAVLRLVMNKVEPDVGIDLAQAQQAFERRFVAGLDQSRAVSRSINAGTVLLEHEPRDRVASQLRACAHALLPEHLAARLPGGGSPRPRWWRLPDRLQRRSALPPLDPAPTSGACA